jgi:pyruvate-ferredoxin/flavodoxin oxidoreductase
MEYGHEKSMEVAMTFADFALTEARFRKHFRKVPRSAWNDNMVPLVEFLEMDENDREGKFPFIWAVDLKQRLNRVLVAEKIVESCEERRDFWIMLRDISGYKIEEIQEENIEEKIRAEVVGKIARGLMKMAGGDGPGIADMVMGESSDTVVQDAPTNSEYMAPWLDTEECTSCDECTQLNPKIFAYNINKKAFIQNPDAGPYEDLVKAAEKCTAGVIHPGLPADRSAKDMDKWIKRGEKYN